MMDNSDAPNAPCPGAFNPAATARSILRRVRIGALATTEEGGRPFVSLITVATCMSGAPVMLMSKLARHTRNLERDPRAALLMVAPGSEAGIPLAGARLTVSGRIIGPIGPDVDRELARRFLARHPAAESYAGFGDFGFYCLEIEEGHLVAGFGRIVALAASELVLDLNGAEALIAGEADAVAHINTVHRDALRLFAVRLCGAVAGDWRASGLDPHGLDLLSADGRPARLDFPHPVTTPQALQRLLKRLADQTGRAPSA